MHRGTGEIQSIQILRFIAASMVVLAHTSSGHFPIGGAGVDIFFVISGFIITRIMQKRSAKSFLWDRFTRIYPIYWLCLAPMVLLTWQAGHWEKLAASITLWPIYGQFERQYLVPAWTLCFEVLFYCGAAFVLWKRAFVPVLILGYAAAMTGGFLTGNAVLMFLGNPLTLEFGYGIIIALAVRNIGEAPASRKFAGAILIVLGAAALPLLRAETFGEVESTFVLKGVQRCLVWGLPAAAIVWGALQWEQPFRHWIGRLLRYGGAASYSIYLSHGLFLTLFKPHNPYLLLGATPLYIGLGMAVHSLVEAPLLRAVRRHKRATSPVEQIGVPEAA